MRCFALLLSRERRSLFELRRLSSLVRTSSDSLCIHICTIAELQGRTHAIEVASQSRENE